MSGPLLSVVLSFRNEADVIPELIDRLTRALEGAAIEHELIFVNDASSDDSLALLEKRRLENPRVKVINIGQTDEGRDCLVVVVANEETVKIIETYRG